MSEYKNKITEIKKRAKSYGFSIENQSDVDKKIKLFSLDYLNTVLKSNTLNPESQLSVRMMDSDITYEEFIKYNQSNPIGISMISLSNGNKAPKDLSQILFINKKNPDLVTFNQNFLHLEESHKNSDSEGNTFAFFDYIQDGLTDIELTITANSVLAISLHHNEEETVGEIETPTVDSEEKEESKAYKEVVKDIPKEIQEDVKEQLVKISEEDILLDNKEKIEPVIVKVNNLHPDYPPVKETYSCLSEDFPRDKVFCEIEGKKGVDGVSKKYSTVSPFDSSLDDERPSPSPYQIIFKNTTNKAKTAVLGGFNRFFNKSDSNFGSEEGVEVNISQANVSYEQFLAQSALQPFTTSLIRLQSKTEEQVKEPIFIDVCDANGQETVIPLITQSFWSKKQFQKNILDIPYSVNFDGNTYFSISLLPEEELVITIFPSEKVNLSYILGSDFYRNFNNYKSDIEKSSKTIKDLVSRIKKMENKKSWWEKLFSFGK